ncbi:hypothetical protein JOL62DRAFT_175987 [Phyllosticta paracitricarpa]|uniref:Uncharacterized protein n=1 Tax=Phyllosticta paracitricarpa TaxID=2016321 RepID=A0ABR1N636_9PEZI
MMVVASFFPYLPGPKTSALELDWTEQSRAGSRQRALELRQAGFFAIPICTPDGWLAWMAIFFFFSPSFLRAVCSPISPCWFSTSACLPYVFNAMRYDARPRVCMPGMARKDWIDDEIDGMGGWIDGHERTAVMTVGRSEYAVNVRAAWPNVLATYEHAHARAQT